ncbi:MAG: TolC family protein [Hyphomonadaceae bacterium]|nr:TolC family protein [Hyphomonadaceae bacterium]
MIGLGELIRARAIATALGSLAILLSPSATAETLEDAFRDAVASSPDLAARRARIEAQRQSILLAYSEALPQVTATIGAQRVDRDDPARRITGTEFREEWRAGADASQLLFGSGRVRAAIRQARAQLASSEASYREAMQALLLQASQAFAEVRRTRAVEAAQEATLANLQEQRSYVIANQRAGFLTLTDVAQADARVAASRSQLARAKADVIGAERAFARIVGRAPSALDRPDTPPALPTDIDAALELALGQRQNLEAARQSEAAAQAGVDAAHAGGRPRLSLEANSFIDNGIEFEDDDRVLEDVLALRMTIPIFSGGANRVRARQQRAVRAAARYDIAIAQREVHQGVATALADLEAARAAELAAQEEIKAAELALRGIRREQQSGLRSVIDVLNQEQDLLSARLSMARAESDVLIAERSVQFQTGTLVCVTCAPLAED